MIFFQTARSIISWTGMDGTTGNNFLSSGEFTAHECSEEDCHHSRTNGAGKTTFAREYLPGEADCPDFINVDLIAGLRNFQEIYRGLASSWIPYNNSGPEPRFIESGDN
jgi:hypothetical protein